MTNLLQFTLNDPCLKSKANQDDTEAKATLNFHWLI